MQGFEKIVAKVKNIAKLLNQKMVFLNRCYGRND
jgi:hypothetical protein